MKEAFRENYMQVRGKKVVPDLLNFMCRNYCIKSLVFRLKSSGRSALTL